MQGRADEEARAANDEIAKANAKLVFKNQWENSLDRIGSKSATLRSATQQKASKQEALESRRERYGLDVIVLRDSTHTLE